MHAEVEVAEATIDRRKLLLGAATGVAGAGAAGALIGASGASASSKHRHPHGGFRKIPAPRPIPGSIFLGEGLLFENIHWFGPGQGTSAFNFIPLDAFGQDAQASTVGDFDGVVAYTIMIGSAETNEGTQDLEVDIRVMQGHYIGVDGKKSWGTFGFF